MLRAHFCCFQCFISVPLNGCSSGKEVEVVLESERKTNIIYRLFISMAGDTHMHACAILFFVRSFIDQISQLRNPNYQTMIRIFF